MANNVSFSGVGSGIDFNTIRDAIISSRSRPITQLQNKGAQYSNRVEALKQLNATLAGLTNAAKALNNKEIGNGRNASASDASILTAGSSNTAALGQFDVTVTRLATSLSQASRSYATATTEVLAGGATTATFELRKGGAATGTAITIDSVNNTLTGLRDAINAAGADITAAIVDLNGDGTQQQLVLSSKDTGTSGRVEVVETTATGTGADLNLRTLNPVDGDINKLNAALTINGLSVTRSSNTVTDAVAGITLSLKKTGAVNVQVSNSTEIRGKLESFVSAYNDVQDFIAKQYQTDGRGRPTGVLAGDSVLRTVQQQLREAVGNISDTNGGALTSLADLGVGRTDSGKLTLDAAVLSEKLSSNYQDVRAFFVGQSTTQTGFAQSFYATSDALSNSVTGSVLGFIKGYEDSIKNINDSINNGLERINTLRDILTRQFAAADAAIGQLNGQGTALTGILKSLQSNNNNK